MLDSKPPSTLKQALGLDDLAAVVREQHQIVVGATHGMLNAATAAGDALIAAHNEISHGEWGRWLREDCLNERTARRYVQLAENRGWFEANRSCAATPVASVALNFTPWNWRSVAADTVEFGCIRCSDSSASAPSMINVGPFDWSNP